MSDVRGGSAGLPGDPPGGRRAMAVWGIGVSVYFVAVIFRTSLGVAGLDAVDRFHVNASALSTFSILQLLVYAGMQIPVVVLVLLLLFLRDHPEGHEPEALPYRGPSYVRRQIAASWREPGTRLGLWVHFTTQFPAMVFLLLWGMPFLVEAQGLSRATAGELLTLVVLANMAVGLVYGQIIARHHEARLPLALGTVGATALMWAVTLTYPGERAPMWLLVVLCTVLGACGPASMLGFDFARPANPPERQGTASGITNMGGFVASMTTLFAVGVLLDATDDNYTVAFSSVFVLQALGISQILRLRGRAARRERERLVASRVETVHVP